MPKESILKVIANNQPLFDEVKRVILDEFRFENVNTQQLSNERLGEIKRFEIDGKAKVEAAFQKIVSYQTQDNKPEQLNPAR